MNELSNSKKLYEKAKLYISGGISSQIRTLEHSEVPLFIKSAKGSKIWDVDNNEYIDYIQGMGPNIFGHAPNFLNNAVSNGLSCATLSNCLSGFDANILLKFHFSNILLSN